MEAALIHVDRRTAWYQFNRIQHFYCNYVSCNNKTYLGHVKCRIFFTDFNHICFFINIFLEAPDIILHWYMQMDKAKLIRTSHYYVNGPGNQNNFLFPGRWYCTNRFMTVSVNLKVSRICHYKHHITFSAAVTSIHTCNPTDCIFFLKKKDHIMHMIPCIFLIVVHPIVLWYMNQQKCHAICKSYIYN